MNSKTDFKSKKTFIRRAFAIIIAAAGYLVIYPLTLFQCILPTQFRGEWSSGIGMHAVYAEMVSTIDQVLKHVFSDADSIQIQDHNLGFKTLFSIQQESGIEVNPTFDSRYRFFIAMKGETILGYAAEHTVSGKWGPIHYLLSLNPDGSIADVSVLDYQERRGRPISKSRFTKQFNGKKITDPLKLQTDIRGVTGASISSKGITDGIRKTLYVFNTLYSDR